jgi:hypothetical protein
MGIVLSEMIMAKGSNRLKELSMYPENMLGLKAMSDKSV